MITILLVLVIVILLVDYLEPATINARAFVRALLLVLLIVVLLRIAGVW